MHFSFHELYNINIYIYIYIFIYNFTVYKHIYTVYALYIACENCPNNNKWDLTFTAG